MPQPQKNQRLTLSFLYASYGEQVVQQLINSTDYISGDYADIFTDEAIQALLQYKDRIIGREDRSWDQCVRRVAATVMDEFFAKAYPEAKQKPQIAQWVVKQYLTHRHNGKPILAEDLYKIKENIEYFDSLKKSFAFKETGASADLLSYKTYAGFEAMLQPFRERRAVRDARADMLFGLKPEQRKKITSETTTLYDGPEGCIVVPHTPAASKFWGSHTRWCIAGREYAENYFPSYNRGSPVIMILPKGHDDDKVALVGRRLYNSADNTIPVLPELHRNLMQNCLEGLSKGARQNIALWVPEEILVPDEIPQPGAPAPAAVRNEPEMVIRRQYPDENRRNDSEYMLQFIGSNEYLAQYLSPELKSDHAFMLALVAQNPKALRYASEKLRANREIVLAAVTAWGGALEYAANKLKADRNIVRAAVSTNGTSIRYASDKLRNDPEIALAAVKAYSYVFIGLPKKLQNNYDIALAAAADTLACGYIPEKYRADPAFAFAAIEKNIHFLKDASDKLKSDPEFMLAVVKRNVYAFEYADRKLKANPEIAYAAVIQDEFAFSKVAPELQNDVRFISSLMEVSDDFPFEHTGKQPDEASLMNYRVKALERMIEKGHTEKFIQYARQMKAAWGDPDILFAADPAATLAKIKAAIPANQNVKRAPQLAVGGM